MWHRHRQRPRSAERVVRGAHNVRQIAAKQTESPIPSVHVEALFNARCTANDIEQQRCTCTHNRVIIDVFLLLLFCLAFCHPLINCVCVKCVFAAEKGRLAFGQRTGAVDGAVCVAAGPYSGCCRSAKPRQHVLHECCTAMPEPHRYLGRIFCARSVQGGCGVPVSHTR